jgi:hypothetical protein
VSSQLDFVNEVTLLQYFTQQRSVPASLLSTNADPQPKVSSRAKQWYRRQKLVEKRTKDKYRKLVTQSLNQVNINPRMEFSRTARQYMIAHQTIESFNNDPEAAGKNLETSQLY